MRKKILFVSIALVFLCSIVFVLFDCFLWRVFEFNYCRTPQLLYVSELEIEDNNCYISVEDMCSGSFITTKYNGFLYVFSEGMLKIGVHKGTIGAKEKINKKIVVDSPITEVRLCGNGAEQVIFKK